MKIELTPPARDQLAVLRSTGYRGEGLLLGMQVGEYTLIETLFPLSLPDRKLPDLFARAGRHLNGRIRGVFYINRPICLHPCLLEEWLLHIGNGTERWGICRWNAPGKKPVWEEV